MDIKWEIVEFRAKGRDVFFFILITHAYIRRLKRAKQGGDGGEEEKETCFAGEITKFPPCKFSNTQKETTQKIFPTVVVYQTLLSGRKCVSNSSFSRAIQCVSHDVLFPPGLMSFTSIPCAFVASASYLLLLPFLHSAPLPYPSTPSPPF